MSIASYDFEGPYNSPDSLRPDPGVYAVICEGVGLSTVLDVGQSENVQESVGTHDRRDCWVANCRQIEIRYFVYYLMHEQGRQLIEERVRKEYNVACGEGRAIP